MKLERTRNAARNMLSGWILKLYQIVVPFLLRTAMIWFMGVEYLGLNGLFTSVLQVLNLAELGAGSAMVFSMYRPIAENDGETVCALMKLYRRWYRIIGLVIAVVGLALTPFIPQLISGDIPAGISVQVLYLLDLAAAVLSYWLFACRGSILQAHQRNDAVSRVTLIVSTVQYALQFFTLLLLKNYYIYILISLGAQVLRNIGTAIAAHRLYPQYSPRGQLSRDAVRTINRRIRDLFTAKVGSVVVYSADTIVISAFLGLTVLAVYQNYYYILKSVIGLVDISFSACLAGIGNSLVTETREKNFRDLQKFTFLLCWLAGFCTCCFLCLYQPFMRLWVGEDLMLKSSAVVCFCIYFFVYEINQLLITYKDAAGIWHRDRFRPLCVSAVNLTLNLLLVQVCGIYGVLLSTVLSILLVGLPWLLHNLSTTLFDRAQMQLWLRQMAFQTCIVLVSCLLCGLLCTRLEFSSALLTLLLRAAVCCILPNGLYFLFYRRNPLFRECLQLADRVTGSRLQLERRLMRFTGGDHAR